MSRAVARKTLTNAKRVDEKAMSGRLPIDPTPGPNQTSKLKFGAEQPATELIIAAFGTPLVLGPKASQQSRRSCRADRSRPMWHWFDCNDDQHFDEAELRKFSPSSR